MYKYFIIDGEIMFPTENIKKLEKLFLGNIGIKFKKRSKKTVEQIFLDLMNDSLLKNYDEFSFPNYSDTIFTTDHTTQYTNSPIYRGYDSNSTDSLVNY